MKSWVTSRVGTPVSRRTEASSRPAEARVRASSADSGSSEQERGRSAGQRARNGDPLALAAGEGAWAGLGAAAPVLVRSFEAVGGVPGRVLFDNPKTVATGHLAGAAVLNPDLVRLAAH